jgi:hypothetical protein
MTIAEFFVSKSVTIIKNAVIFFKDSYDNGEIITADGKVFVIVDDGSVCDQLLMGAYKVAKDDKNESLILPSAIIDFVACNIYAFKHNEQEFDKADLEKIRRYFNRMLSAKNRNLVFMLLALVVAQLADHIMESQASMKNVV